MASSSSSSSQSWNHHVFLSFRGEDTRKTFVDHLYTALVQQGLYTYKDDETLPHGEYIGPSLLKAIEESQIVVVVFSKNYADSTWCLDELAHIMKCKDTRGKIVMPVFYDVEPSQVRKQTCKYGEAFSKHELENYNKVETWRKALEDAGNLSGWEPKHIANGHESKCIKEIVDTISHRLHQVLSSANENRVGVEARVQDLKSKLQIGSGGVVMIGIWGVGGGGKTTLASSVYDEISDSFEGCCFVENIREESIKNGLIKLQEKILSGVLKQKEVEIKRIEEGRRMIKDRLFNKKVLLVLDDVARLDHLEGLAGSHDWFGEGSRIIITTRDNHLLKARKVNVIHDVSLLNDDEAIMLFRKLAPRDYRPVEDYEMLSKYVVSYAGGLPLALKVLGCFLCDKDMNEWRSTLARLKEIPDNDILEKLKISYDGLTEKEKELFLDITCYFRGENKDYAMHVFYACGFHPVIGVKVLVQKALITISDGKFDMHDLLEEMGHYIVRGEHPRNPEKHTRVWKNEDVRKIHAMGAKTELDKIEAIRYEEPWRGGVGDPLPCHIEVVANMKKLRWIHWRDRCTSPLSTSFPPLELCCLTLDSCHQRQLWKGYKHLPNLRMIKLYKLVNLIKTPDFDGLPNLERFILEQCPHLEEIHPSFGRLERLVFLTIYDCNNLKKFPPITHSHELETFILSGCPKPFTVSKSGKKVASYKQYSNNFFVTCWTSGCNNVDSKYGLEEPSLCENNIIIKNIGLKYFHEALRKLTLRNCNLGDGDVDSVFWDIPNLKELDIGWNKFSRLNVSLLQLPRLKWLDVSFCEKLVELSGLPSSLAGLCADSCGSLESAGDLSNCKWLWKVSFAAKNNMGPLGGNIIVDYMLKGNAIENHFISFNNSGHYIPKRFVDRMVKGETFTLELPHNWYYDFSGFFICNANGQSGPCFTIIMKEEQDKDSQSEVSHESNEETEPYFNSISVGYVSFNSLMRHTTWLNLAYNTINVSLENPYKTSFKVGSRFAVELVPRKSKLDPMQTTKGTTDYSEFFEREYWKTFTIQHHSKSSIKILWYPRR